MCLVMSETRVQKSLHHNNYKYLRDVLNVYFKYTLDYYLLQLFTIVVRKSFNNLLQQLEICYQLHSKPANTKHDSYLTFNSNSVSC